MERLTFKDEEYCMEDGTVFSDCIEKLGQLEDIEEELGIDLITLFKALKEGVYFKSELNGITGKHSLIIDNIIVKLSLIYINECGYYSTRDYGKSWALTKEELQ